METVMCLASQLSSQVSARTKMLHEVVYLRVTRGQIQM